MEMERFLFTLLVGACGGAAGYYIKLPAGAMLGAMIAVGLYNVTGFKSYMPPQARLCVQVVLGCVLGLNLNRQAFAAMKEIVVPLIIIIFSLLFAGIVVGIIIYKVCGLDLATAVLGSSPGGMTELSLLAVSLGADGPKVALLHAVRMITVVALMPLVLNLVGSLFGSKGG